MKDNKVCTFQIPVELLSVPKDLGDSDPQQQSLNPGSNSVLRLESKHSNE